MNKVALITGASRGLGQPLATFLAGRGFHLIITARGAEALDATACALANYGQQVIALVGEELAPYYCIDGQRAERKTIRLDRGLVEVDEEWRGAKV